MKKLKQGNIVAVRDGGELATGHEADNVSDSSSDSDEDEVIPVHCSLHHSDPWQATVSDYWIGVVEERYKEISEDCHVGGTSLEKGDEYIVVQWLIHDRWDGDNRIFVQEDVPHYVLWQQGAIITCKGLGSIGDGRRTYTLTEAKHKAIMALLKPAAA